MQGLILGAGQTGCNIARYLQNRNINVTLVEKSEEVANYVRNELSLNVITGDALSINILKEANIRDVDLVISMLPTDEQNLVACKLIGLLFKTQIKVAFIQSLPLLQDENLLKSCFDIDVILRPADEISKLALDIIQTNGALDFVRMNDAVLVKLKCKEGTEIINTSFKHFQEITDFNFFVMNISRNGKTFFPSSSDLLLADDEVYLLTFSSQLTAVMELFGYPQSIKRNLVIIGAGSITVALLQKLQEQDCVVIERSLSQAEKVSLMFPDVRLIHGDALDARLLIDVVSNIDTAVVLTHQNENNALISQFLQQLNVKRILTLMDNDNYNTLLNREHNIVINSNDTIAQILNSKLNENKNISIYHLKDSNTNLVEITITELSHYLGKTIADIKSTNCIMPAFIIRKGKILFAREHHTMELNDKILLSVSQDGLSKLVKEE